MMIVRRKLSTDLPLAVVAALTSSTVLLSWRGLSAGEDPWLAQALMAALLLGLLGAVLRSSKVPVAIVFLIQLVVGAISCSLALAGIGATGLSGAVQDAVATAREYVAPVPPDAAPLDPLLLPAGLLMALVVDLVAVGLRRVSLAGPVLVAAYAVPVSVLNDDPVAWWLFALAAIGFLLMLYLQELELLNRWGGRAGPGGSAGSVSSGPSNSFRGTMATAAVASIALAVMVPLFIPRLDLGGWGDGRGSGSGDIRVSNPMIDLRRDLVRGADRRLINVTTDDPDPSYLRMSVLTRFTGSEWSPGDRSIPPDQDGTGSLPALSGVDSDLQRTRYSWSLQATDALQSTWLPLPENVRRVDASGPWRWDEATRDFTSTEEDTTTSGLSWTAVGARLNYDPDVMSRSASSLADVSTDYIDLPDDFPAEIRELSREVTASGRSKFEQAVLLQEWFRRDGGFEYTTEVSAGNGTDDLVTFLGEGPESRRGYCEQFAASMAAMARSLNIPARVAVGFLKPEQVGPQEWEFSSHDLHAWPELYFSGAGWVRFEPTPPTRASGIPAYTEFQFDRPEDESSASAAPSTDADTPAPDSSAAEQRELDPGQGAVEQETTGVSAWLSQALIGGGLLLLAVLLALTPRLLRRRRAAERAEEGTCEAAWAELRDVAVDLRLPWPHATTPRATAILVADHFGDGSGTREHPARGAALAPDAVQALHRICLEVERARFARPGTVADAVDWADVNRCQDALIAGASRRAQRRAAWWPRSIFARESATGRRSTSTVVERSGTVDHLG